MNQISYKAKQFLVLTAKFLVVGLAFWFIYKKLSDTDWLNWSDFQNILKENFTIGSILLILLLSVANRFFEILKWKNLANLLTPVSVFQATQQVLSALVFALLHRTDLENMEQKPFFFQNQKPKM